jgi:hypothetical protein
MVGQNREVVTRRRIWKAGDEYGGDEFASGGEAGLFADVRECGVRFATQG